MPTFRPCDYFISFCCVTECPGPSPIWLFHHFQERKPKAAETLQGPWFVSSIGRLRVRYICKDLVCQSLIRVGIHFHAAANLQIKNTRALKNYRRKIKKPNRPSLKDIHHQFKTSRKIDFQFIDMCFFAFQFQILNLLFFLFC